MEIIPSILEQTKEGVLAKVEALRPLGLTAQVDLMDGEFVPSRSLEPVDLPAELRSIPWEAHLMVRDPVAWSHAVYLLGCQRVYWHAEVVSDVAQIPRHFTKVEHGLALRLETPIDIVDRFVPVVRSVLLLSIDEPGFQGKTFHDAAYDKIRELKRRHPGVVLTVDGGVNLEHLKPMRKLGVDRVAVGSAFWKYGDPKTVLAAFRQASL